MALTTSDLQQIRTIVREEIDPVKQDLAKHHQETKAGFKKLTKNLAFSVNFLEKQDITIQKRVARLENHIGLPSSL